jgi:hypothetical protein
MAHHDDAVMFYDLQSSVLTSFMWRSSSAVMGTDAGCSATGSGVMATQELEEGGLACRGSGRQQRTTQVLQQQSLSVLVSNSSCSNLLYSDCIVQCTHLFRHL